MVTCDRASSLCSLAAAALFISLIRSRLSSSTDHERLASNMKVHAAERCLRGSRFSIDGAGARDIRGMESNSKARGTVREDTGWHRSHRSSRVTCMQPLSYFSAGDKARCLGQAEMCIIYYNTIIFLIRDLYSNCSLVWIVP